MFDSTKIKDEIVQWIKAYFKQNASQATKAIIGISGGKDSSIVAALCVHALGKKRVFGVLMPDGSQQDIGMSYDICAALDIDYIEVNIHDSVQALYAQIKSQNLELNTVATFNTPSRIRMAMLYAVSAIVGGRVANTSNLSEDYIGYATKFGDTAGDFSPLSNFTVSEVKAIGYALNLDKKFIEKPPLDGLCGKTDEDNLGFSYDVLDSYVRHNRRIDPKIRKVIDGLHKNNLHKVQPMPKFDY